MTDTAANRIPQYMKKCSVSWCVKNCVAKDLCHTHHRRMKKGKDLEKPFRQYAYFQTHCNVEGCLNKHNSYGLCQAHYARKKRGIPLDRPWKTKPYDKEFCKVDGCNEDHYSRGYCTFHLQRFKRGKSFDDPRFVIIRDKTFDQIVWKINNCGYLTGSWQGKKVIQHRVFWEIHHGRKLKTFENIHHINGIRDDNRIENLELWTKPQPCGQRPEDLVAWVIEHYREDVLRAIDTRLELPLQPQRQQP